MILHYTYQVRSAGGRDLPGGLVVHHVGSYVSAIAAEDIAFGGGTGGGGAQNTYLVAVYKTASSSTATVEASTGRSGGRGGGVAAAGRQQRQVVMLDIPCASAASTSSSSSSSPPPPPSSSSLRAICMAEQPHTSSHGGELGYGPCAVATVPLGSAQAKKGTRRSFVTGGEKNMGESSCVSTQPHYLYIYTMYYRAHGILFQ